MIGLIAGVDEAGRGPLAGEVCAAAVVLDDDNSIVGLDDSKKISDKKRRELSETIKSQAAYWSISVATVEEIVELNILQATLLAMRRAVEQLSITPSLVLVDGNQDPMLGVPTRTIIQGDRKEACISAASILAKVARDDMMLTYDKQYPKWGFTKHKGYGTKQHLDAIRTYGITPIHRLTFEPIKTLLSSK